jgi:N-acetylneuraminic acid mutarotase
MHIFFCASISRKIGNMKRNVRLAVVLSFLLSASCKKDGSPTEHPPTTTPEKPELILPDTSGTGNYFIRWRHFNAALSFLLQESTEPTFLNSTTAYSGTDTLTRIGGKPFNTAYYYRVRANLSQDVSLWSDTKAIVVVQRPTPNILVTISRMDFGDTYVDSLSTRKVQIRNTGSATLHITSVITSNPIFSPTTITLSVLAGGSDSLQFVFRPTTIGTDSSSVILYNNDPDDYPPVFKLTGNAVASSVIRWSSLPDLPIPLTGPAGATIGSKIYVIGGYSTQPSPTMFVFDTLTQNWSQLASMSIARHDFAAGSLAGKVYAVGGRDSLSNFISLVEEYDPPSNTWTTKAPMPTARAGHGMVRVGVKLFAIGGYSPANGFARIKAVEAYDPSTNSWQALADMPTGRNGLGLCTDGTKIFALGGYYSGSNAAFEEYLVSSNLWTHKPDMPTPRGGFAAIIYNQIIYAVGGAGTSIDEYNVLTGRWIRTRTGMPVDKPGFLAVLLGRNIYVIGGSGGPALASCEQGTIMSQP